MKVFVKFVILLFMVMITFSCGNNHKRSGFAFGIDVSQYQGDINWHKVKDQKKTKEPVSFVIVRATMGTRIDDNFFDNFAGAKKEGFIVGAYHYYDPNQSSKLQAENFKKVAKLSSGNILPVLDIEKLSSVQSNDRLKQGLQNWLNIIEEYYGVKPIIYTKLKMWKDFLSEDFANYPIWIAAYSEDRRNDTTVKSAVLHQFSDNVRLPGINSNTVDASDCSAIEKILIP